MGTPAPGIVPRSNGREGGTGAAEARGFGNSVTTAARSTGAPSSSAEAVGSSGGAGGRGAGALATAVCRGALTPSRLAGPSVRRVASS